jgi:hypothetical protein
MKKRIRRVTVADSGAATAPGGVAISGTNSGDITLSTGAPVDAEYYRREVKLIAPTDLLDRKAEVDELTEFCISQTTAGKYTWWQADAWSGKSALMSWFVLHPPPNVRIVSFFVTSQQSDRNDRAAFSENVLNQLLELLDKAHPSSASPSMLGLLLKEAAVVCGRRGEHLVLMVDGLDEDRGVHDGPDSYSIAALLPHTSPAGLRVIVSGRLTPPLPFDVPHTHPLRDPTVACAGQGGNFSP